MVQMMLENRLADINYLVDYPDLDIRELYSPLGMAIGLESYDIAHLLLSNGPTLNSVAYDYADPDDQSDGRFTALALAIWQNQLVLADDLIKMGADVNGGDGNRFPLQEAARVRSASTIRLLLEKGANAYAKEGAPGWYEGCPLQTVVGWKSFVNIDTVRLLLRHNADPNLTTPYNRHTSLQIACREGRKDLVDLLINYGADINSPPAKNHGATALQFAAIGGYVGIAHLLVRKGADVNAPPAKVDGRTALEGAAEHGRIDMIQYLINANADISESNGSYERSLQRASKNGHMAL